MFYVQCEMFFGARDDTTQTLVVSDIRSENKDNICIFVSDILAKHYAIENGKLYMKNQFGSYNHEYIIDINEADNEITISNRETLYIKYYILPVSIISE